MWNSIVRHTDTCVFNFTTNRTMRFGQRYTNQFTTWRIANCVYQYILNCPFHLCLFHFTAGVSNVSGFAEKYNSIVSSVQNAMKIPSFTSRSSGSTPTVTMSGNQVSVTDSNLFKHCRGYLCKCIGFGHTKGFNIRNRKYIRRRYSLSGYRRWTNQR